MKRFAAVIAGVSLFSFSALAVDAVTVDGHRNADGTGHVKTSRKHKHGKTTDTTTTDHKVSKDAMGGGTTETKDSVSDHDTAGGKTDSKVETKETIKRDSAGKVTEHETKTTAGK
jgi:hypothetical protein